MLLPWSWEPVWPALPLSFYWAIGLNFILAQNFKRKNIKSWIVSIIMFFCLYDFPPILLLFSILCVCHFFSSFRPTPPPLRHFLWRTNWRPQPQKAVLSRSFYLHRPFSSRPLAILHCSTLWPSANLLLSYCVLFSLCLYNCTFFGLSLYLPIPCVCSYLDYVSIIFLSSGFSSIFFLSINLPHTKVLFPPLSSFRIFSLCLSWHPFLSFYW